MPGIFGCIRRDGDNVSEKVAIEMADSLKHEDWYVDEWILDPCLLGAVELGFLHGGNSLIYRDGGSLVGVSRGSIYNKQELSRRFGIQSADSYLNDTRLIVELYENEGSNFAKHLNGLFVAAIYDKEKDRIIVVNDRYGYYPLFYSVNSKSFVFASEAKAVLKDQALAPRMDRTAIPEFFSFSFLLGEKTFFREVKGLLPACTLTFDRTKDRIRIERYWDFVLKKHDPQKTFGSYLAEFNKHMKLAVERRVKDREIVGIFLSGGLDSRIIAAFASETKTPVITLTFGVKNCLERKIASEVAARLGIENIFYEIPSDFIANYAKRIVYRGDGLIRIRDCHFIALLDEVRKKVRTVLLGTFGGDLNWPYPLSEKLSKLETRKEVINYLFKFYNSTLSNVLPIDEYRRAFTDAFYTETKGLAEKNFARTFDEIKFGSPFDIADYWEYRNRQPRYIFQASQYINWYLETRHPFLDNDLVDFLAFRLPTHLRRREMFGMVVEVFLQKAINSSFPSLSDIPWRGLLPNPSILDVLLAGGRYLIHKKVISNLERILRTKLPISPIDFRGYDDWLRTGSKVYALDILLNPRTLKRDFFRPEFVTRRVKDHMNHKENRGQLVCDLINFELMNRIFFDACCAHDDKNLSAV
jgi:asparagine synthase (glutamine-hydrolysing)